eukprot:scaffold10348_cov54-Attheya_sp.AAC.4
MEAVNKQKEEKDAAVAEISSLGRVSHKLAMTDAGDPLEKVLGVLLPRLLLRIGNNHARNTANSFAKAEYDKIHAKLVEMISHAMKRVRADQQCQLPCSAILGLLYDGASKVSWQCDEIGKNEGRSIYHEFGIGISHTGSASV